MMQTNLEGNSNKPPNFMTYKSLNNKTGFTVFQKSNAKIKT
uniref:Uncharacterized protein n=1 Tax=Rhizophora mucronata TaxID=61149 RepID=A0A2P2MXZ3_RHIMU